MAAVRLVSEVRHELGAATGAGLGWLQHKHGRITALIRVAAAQVVAGSSFDIATLVTQTGTHWSSSPTHTLVIQRLQLQRITTLIHFQTFALSAQVFESLYSLCGTVKLYIVYYSP